MGISAGGGKTLGQKSMVLWEPGTRGHVDCSSLCQMGSVSQVSQVACHLGDNG